MWGDLRRFSVSCGFPHLAEVPEKMPECSENIFLYANRASMRRANIKETRIRADVGLCLAAKPQQGSDRFRFRRMRMHLMHFLGCHRTDRRADSGSREFGHARAYAPPGNRTNPEIDSPRNTISNKVRSFLAIMLFVMLFTPYGGENLYACKRDYRPGWESLLPRKRRFCIQLRGVPPPCLVGHGWL